MQNLGEIVAAGLFGYLFYSMATMRVKNEGDLMVADDASGGEVVPSTDELAEEKGPIYGDASDITGRDPDTVCQVKPAEMLSTSLLPASGDQLEDDDFVSITPEKLDQINFLDAGWALGRDTQTNTMRNASYDLRSEPANPKLLTMENNSFSNPTIDYQFKRSFEPETPSADLSESLAAA
jgi:hypothetical protein